MQLNSVPKPKEFKRLGPAGLSVSWNNGVEQTITSRRLREACPCASCRENRGALDHEKPLTAKKKSALSIVTASSEEELNLVKIWPVGNYALGIEWGDGHQTGIYTYELLYELGGA